MLCWSALLFPSVAGADAPPIQIIKDQAGWPIAIETQIDAADLDRWKNHPPANAEYQRILTVSVTPETNEELPALAGDYTLTGSTLRFTPRFRLNAGMRYRAIRHFHTGAAPFVSGFDLPAVFAAPTNKVTQIYPSGPLLPENQLRFYIHFSAPMQSGDAYRHIELLDEKGVAIADPFLEIGEEMWDPSGSRFTLLVDPGRIKRGLKPREDVGPVFEAGKAYSLVIHSTWRDAANQPLVEKHVKQFRIGIPDTRPLDTSQWKWSLPRSGTREPLKVMLSKSLDHALLQRCLFVESTMGRIPGTVTVGDQERSWQFQPTISWPAGEYWLEVNAAELEDSAGNRIGASFEVDEIDPPVPPGSPIAVERIPLGSLEN